MTRTPLTSALALLAASLVASGCDGMTDGGEDAGPSPGIDAGRGGGGDAGPGAGEDAGPGGSTDAGLGGGDAGPGGGADAGGPPPAGSAADWIRMHFASDPDITGTITTRTRVETPALVHDADACCAKYAFDVREAMAPDRREVGFVDVLIHDLVSGDAFGGGVQTSGAPGVDLFMANVVVEPNWPMWISYSETNKDGLVLDDSNAIYAEDLTIRNWNADGAIDNKAQISQFVRLTIEGRGNRGIRYWQSGPHYLVDSNLHNDGGWGEGSIFWFSNCSTAVVNVYNSTFNGMSTIPNSLISCDNGSSPTINYLTVDPRTTGEMHEMFTP
ncbi:MAG: hypothetical protein AB7S26_08125 [Sandaracinaceae bacterium]